MSKPLTYLRYLKLDELLTLQQPLSTGPEHDELLFIVIHQVYELWFKELLHEARYLREAFVKGNASHALAALNRIRTVFKTLVGQVDILETMTPLSFNAFRTRLDAASGFQSAQFRELEFLLGHRRPELVAGHPEGAARDRLSDLLTQPSVYDAFLQYLHGSGYPMPQEALTRDYGKAAVASGPVQEVLIQVYRAGGFPAQVCERLVDVDEGLQEWRYRHVKMVERTIGAKIGTGGSAGAAYLRETLFRPLFPDLWEIRSRL